MKIIPKTKDGIALLVVATLTISFFLSGLFDVLDIFIVKVMLVIGVMGLLAIAVHYALKNETKKNRPED
ncbi:hypothetical protein HNV08_06935 [Winogradskyella eckloniae]|uniref:hypothetical protein n=1 Tax=Winogradskyella eckloniae TaxID=1089306 RepID=UPI001563A2B2|nr:hypothetical protein [Winogradskyella eckloniae]NRD19779.1 hypothetical protein [Winogradskyella eckloniae]